MSTVEREETTVDLDDLDLTCDFMFDYEPCQNTAEWIGENPCHPSPRVMVCQRCKDHTDSMWLLMCDTCRGPIKPRWSRL